VVVLPVPVPEPGCQIAFFQQGAGVDPRSPHGQRHPPTAFVFGNEVGERVASVRKSWEATVLRSHGTTPAYLSGTHALTPECRATLRAIDLHFHDLRHYADAVIMPTSRVEHAQILIMPRAA
jgi:hypothetical protein